MTQQPFNAAALRGAVDLSALSRPAPARPGTPGPTPAGGPAGPGAAPGGGAEVVHASDATFNEIVTGTMTVPAVLVLWAEQLPQSREHLDVLAGLARSFEGRFRVVAVELAANPGIMQALSPVLQQAFGQVSDLPVVLGLLSGQPMPFYLGAQPEEQVRPLLEQFLQAAVANGVTGRVEGAGPAQESAEDDGEQDLPAAHQEAYDAIDSGDLDAAAEAFRRAIQDNPADEEARLGLGQVELLRRTQDMDPAAVRQAAAEEPANARAQIDAADLELVGGHVEDAFARLVDTVRRTAGEERDQVREHLLGLFEVIGSQDPRVVKARQALMSALF